MNLTWWPVDKGLRSPPPISIVTALIQVPLEGAKSYPRATLEPISVPYQPYIGLP